jgi:hypothetical protein
MQLRPITAPLGIAARSPMTEPSPIEHPCNVACEDSSTLGTSASRL